MIFFIGTLVVCLLFLIIFIILGFKTYQRKNENKKITHINDYKRKNDNRLMLISVLGAIVSILIAMSTLLNSVPSPTIYPLNTEATVYNETAKVDIESYPIFNIYYSLNGSDPKSGYIYTDSFTVAETTTVVARNRFLHFFWSETSKNTFRFENAQNITVNSVDNNIDDQITVKDFFSYLIIILVFGTVLVLAIRGELDK